MDCCVYHKEYMYKCNLCISASIYNKLVNSYKVSYVDGNHIVLGLEPPYTLLTLNNTIEPLRFHKNNTIIIDNMLNNEMQEFINSL